jgi:hypothetical protein
VLSSGYQKAIKLSDLYKPIGIVMIVKVKGLRSTTCLYLRWMSPRRILENIIQMNFIEMCCQKVDGTCSKSCSAKAFGINVLIPESYINVV